MRRTAEAPLIPHWNSGKLAATTELELHVVPVILGGGMRMLGPGLGLGGKEAIELAGGRGPEPATT